MELSQLTKTTTRSKKRLGRGYGSLKGGHTSSRGQKGQTSRSKIAIWFEGGQLPQIRRFPFIRGKNRFKSLKKDTILIDLSQLKDLKANTTVNPKLLVDLKLLKPKELQSKLVKILGRGDIHTALNITIPTSKNAQTKIEKAGGKVSREQNS
jgi:large subunit ribosomal protein L15